jgi:hypothetical protein
MRGKLCGLSGKFPKLELTQNEAYLFFFLPVSYVLSFKCDSYVFSHHFRSSGYWIRLEKEDRRNPGPCSLWIWIGSSSTGFHTTEMTFCDRETDFLCWSCWYLAFILYAKAYLTLYSPWPLKIYWVLLLVSLKPSNGFSSC